VKLLVLGGTRFLSHAVALDGVRRGHEVTCACRGESGAIPEGARLLRLDRAQELPDLAGYDVVVDVARHPSWVRQAVAAAPQAHWIFVSTISVYVDSEVTGGGPGVTELHEPIHHDVDLAVDMEAYGPMKVACEQLVLGGTRSALVVRPGLIVGPGDPTGRFTYWPVRLAEAGSDGGEVLAPGSPSDLTQVIDVRDLAEWIVACAEERRTGVLDAVGPAVPMDLFLGEVAAGVGSDAALTWVDQDFLHAHEVAPWAGPDSVPMWLPRPEHDGLSSHDAGPAIKAGMPVRPLADTARDTLAWVREEPGAAQTGISRAREQELLAAWHARG
jgi:2'-hydroxyisoflavone reductase